MGPLPMVEQRVPVRTSGGRYEVAIGAGLLNTLGQRVRQAVTGSEDSGPIDRRARGPRRAVLAFDDALSSDTVAQARQALVDARLTPLLTPLHASEQDKSLARLEELLIFLAKERVERSEPIIALGGGVVGDLAGLAAAIYRRGVPLIHCPTTLLAMVDAAVGGKTAVNLHVPGEGLIKNLVGAFHQPKAVIADVAVLDSLSPRVFRAGLGECVKHGMMAADWGDPALLDWTAANASAILTRDHATLTGLIARNVRVKAEVVAGDEREQAATGGRALLNLGHTFAHALEAIAGEGDPLPHGEAVALGLVAASHAAEALRLCPSGLAARIEALLGSLGLPVRWPNLPPSADILARMKHDKKIREGRVRLVLPTDWGRACVVDDPPAAAIEAGIDALRA